jgi:hypothetical protein
MRINPRISVAIPIQERERRLLGINIVHIEFISTLTHEDENRLAPAVLKLLSGVLELLPIAYTIRVETTDQQVLQHASAGTSNWDPLMAVPPDLQRPTVES